MEKKSFRNFEPIKSGQVSQPKIEKIEKKIFDSEKSQDVIGSKFDDLECYNFGLGSSGIDQQILIYENISNSPDSYF